MAKKTWLFLLFIVVVLGALTACDEEDQKKFEDGVNAARGVNSATAPYNPTAPIIESVLVLALGVSEIFRRREKSDKENLQTSIEGAFQKGSQQDILHIDDLSRGMDKRVKDNFNKTGTIRIT